MSISDWSSDLCSSDLHGQPEQIVSASWDFASIEGAVDTVIQTIQSGIAIARMELLDTRAMIACNRQSHLGLPECPTLFLEFHGSGASISEQLELVRVLGDANGGRTIRSATAQEGTGDLPVGKEGDRPVSTRWWA